MTNEHTSLEKYTSHTLFERVAKGLWKGYVWEVSWRLNKLQHIDPPVPLSLAALLSRSAGQLNRGPWGSIALCWVLVLTTASYLRLTDSKLNSTVCRTGLYHCLTFACFLWVSHLHPIKPVHSQGDIFDRIHLLFTQVHFFIWELGRGSICYTTTEMVPYFAAQFWILGVSVSIFFYF